MARIDENIIDAYQFAQKPLVLNNRRFRLTGQGIDRWLLTFGRFLFFNSYPYRKRIVIGVATSAVANYQVRVTVNYVSGKMNSDFSDLRFSDASGNSLPYWIESKTDSSVAYVWVKIATTNTTVKQYIYVYYGNPSAVSESNIDNVMDAGLRAFLYDGTGFNTFLGTTIDTSPNYNWGSGTVSINGVGNQTDTASIYWQGWVKPDGLGNTVFYVSADDGQRLYLNGGLVIDNWVDQGETERSYTYNLQTITPIQYNWYENGGGAVARLGWDSVNNAKVYPIPSTFLRCRKYVSGEPSVFVESLEETISSMWNGLFNALRGVFSMSGGGNQYRYVDMTNVSDYVIQSGDILEYDLYWAGANAQVNLDLIASGWTLRDSGLTDQNGYSVHTSATTYNSLAQGKWYSRRIALTGAAVGKTIVNYCLVCENDATATQTGYIANVKIWRGGTVVKNIWLSGAITESVLLNNGTNSHTITPDIAI